MHTRKSSRPVYNQSKTVRAKPLCNARKGLSGQGECAYLTQAPEAIPAPWLNAIHRQAVPIHTHHFRNLADQGFPDAAPSQSDIRIRFTRRTPALSHRVLYWAANHCSVYDAKNLQGAEQAYGGYTNMGVATRKGHTLEFVLQSPRPYVAQQRGTRNAQQWCRHVHFVDLNTLKRNGEEFPTKSRRRPNIKNVLFTLAVFPRTKPLTLEGGRYTCTSLFHQDQPSGLAYQHSMFIGFEQYMMAKAKGVVGIYAATHKDLTPIHDTDLVMNWQATPNAIVAQLNTAKVHREHPLIVYCDRCACEDAQELLYKLTQVGYCNTYYFEHGMGEARAKMAGIKKFLTKRCSGGSIKRARMSTPARNRQKMSRKSTKANVRKVHRTRRIMQQGGKLSAFLDKMVNKYDTRTDSSQGSSTSVVNREGNKSTFFDTLARSKTGQRIMNKVQQQQPGMPATTNTPSMATGVPTHTASNADVIDLSMGTRDGLLSQQLQGAQQSPNMNPKQLGMNEQLTNTGSPGKGVCLIL